MLVSRCFDSSHLHATVMPRKSSLPNSKSEGMQLALRMKDYKKALRFLAMRQNYSRRVDFWKKFTVLSE